MRSRGLPSGLNFSIAACSSLVLVSTYTSPLEVSEGLVELSTAIASAPSSSPTPLPASPVRQALVHTWYSLAPLLTPHPQAETKSPSELNCSIRLLAASTT